MPDGVVLTLAEPNKKMGDDNEKRMGEFCESSSKT